MNFQNQRFTDNLEIDTEIAIEGNRIVVRKKRNVLAYGTLNDSGDEIRGIYTKLYTISNNIERIVKEVFPTLHDGKVIKKNIILPIVMEIAPEFYSHDVVLIDMFDSFVQQEQEYSTIGLLEYLANGRILAISSNDDPIAFGILDENREEILKTYTDTEYQDIGVEKMFSRFNVAK